MMVSSFDPAATSAWLLELEDSAPGKRAGAFYQRLRQLNGADLETDLRLQSLERLRGPVFAVTETLAQRFLLELDCSQSAARKTAKLCLFLHHELATGYERLSGPLAHQRTLASLGRMLLHFHQLGEMPATAFWRRLYRGLADAWGDGEIDHCLDDPVQATRLSPRQQLYRILAFAALPATRFEAADLQPLYQCLQRGDGLEVRREPGGAQWDFDPAQPAPPRRAEAGNSPYGFGLHFQAERCPLPARIATRLRHYLGQPSAEALSAERRVEEIWVGHARIVEELQHRYQHTETLNWLEVPALELASAEEPPPLERKGVHRYLQARLVHHPQDSLALLEVDRTLPFERLLALKLFDGHLILAVVRWIVPGRFGKPHRYGLDLYRGWPQNVQALIPDQGPRPVILLPDRDVMLLPPARLKLGTEILVDTRTLTSGRLLEWCGDFCAYRFQP